MSCIRKPEDWLRKAQEIAKLGNWDQDPETGELWWSDQTYRLFSLDPQTQKMTFEIFITFVHPDDRELIEEVTNLALQSDEHPYKVEYRITIPGQSERYVYEEAHVERNENGKATRIVGIIQDISERKMVENELEKYKSQLEEMVEIKTRELRKTIQAMAGRENRMAELKKSILKLRKQLEDNGLKPVAGDPLTHPTNSSKTA